MKSELEGIVNGHPVAAVPSLWRGGDICDGGYATLQQLGIQDVYCFKNGEDDKQSEIDAEEARLEKLGIVFWPFPLDNQGFFSYDDISKVPKIIEAIYEDVSSQRKVYCHCKHGADRTGVVIACYRIKYMGWTADAAIAEMRKYGNAIYNWGMRDAVREFAERQKGER